MNFLQNCKPLQSYDTSKLGTLQTFNKPGLHSAQLVPFSIFLVMGEIEYKSKINYTCISNCFICLASDYYSTYYIFLSKQCKYSVLYQVFTNHYKSEQIQHPGFSRRNDASKCRGVIGASVSRRAMRVKMDKIVSNQYGRFRS